MTRFPAALLAGTLIAGCAGSGDSERWAEVRKDELVVGVEMTGSLKAVDSRKLGPPPIRYQWNFKISFMPPEGSEIEKDKPVLSFDPTELRQRLERRQNERDATEKELETTVATARMARRNEALAMAEAESAERKAALKAQAPKELTALIEVETARLDLELARATIGSLQFKHKLARRADDNNLKRLRSHKKRAEERVGELQAAMAKMAIPAPKSGTIIYVTNWRGEKKKVGDSAWRAEKVLEIVALDQMKGVGDVDEVDAAKIAVGQAVSLRLEAHPDVQLRGKIAEIANTVQRQSPETPLKVVKIDIEIDPTDKLKLRPGMRFRGEVEAERIAETLVVPLDAVYATPDGPVAYRENGDGTERVKLTLGKRNQSMVEVLAGLKQGDKVARDATGAGR